MSNYQNDIPSKSEFSKKILISLFTVATLLLIAALVCSRLGLI